MPTLSSKSKRREKPLLFVVPGVLMLIIGFGVIIAYSLGGRFTAAGSELIPVALTTIVVGAMSLTRTLLSTFFLFAYAVTALVIVINQHGITEPWLIPFIALLALCVPQVKYASR